MLLDITNLVKEHNLNLTNILHVGAHKAKEYDEYIKLGAKKIHWVEAIDSSYELLKNRLKAPINKVTCAVISDKDNDGNVGYGDVVLSSTSDSYLRSEKSLLVGLGIKNLAVIETTDAILVANKQLRNKFTTIIFKLFFML